MDRHLFLFGGGPPFTINMAKQFASMIISKPGQVSILCMDREGWKEYMPKYTQALIDHGITEFVYLPLPTTPIEQVVESLKNSSAIIIGGGDTNRYADCIVETAISDTIKACYESGIPVAGFSAGALISPDLCVISPEDNEQHEIQYRKGLGLISDVVIAVHFSQWNEEEYLRTAVKNYPDAQNYGIDEGTCIYFVNEHLEAMDGGGVYSLENEKLWRLN